MQTESDPAQAQPSKEDIWAGSVDYGEPPPASPHDDEEDHNQDGETAPPGQASDGGDQKRPKTGHLGASHKKDTLRIREEENPLVLALMERAKVETAYWDGLVILYEETAGVTRQEPMTQRLQSLWSRQLTWTTRCQPS